MAPATTQPSTSGRCILLGIAMLCWGQHSEAHIYKCIKPGNKLELSDRPCPNAQNSIYYVRPTNIADGSFERQASRQFKQQAIEQLQADAEQAQRQQIAAEKRQFQKLQEAQYKADLEQARRERMRSRAAAMAQQNAKMNQSTGQPFPHPGAIDMGSGRHLPGIAGGVIDPMNGTVYHDVGGGFVNSRTGQFSPKQ